VERWRFAYVGSAFEMSSLRGGTIGTRRIRSYLKIHMAIACVISLV